ncbi:MAG TPA: sigma-70 family RNA polymerase sigma factor [Bryobacteraceae bacterium]|jgi:RNA polymerase sigma-70 factor (ECF subfamily)
MAISAIHRQDELYGDAAQTYGAAIDRLARAYEADSDRRRDLVQEIHVALWRSFEAFDGRCSMRTWVYRVAHNVAATHVIRDQRANRREWVSIEAVESRSAIEPAGEADLDHRRALARLTAMIQQLKPLDRQVIVPYLEGMDAASIGEISGISARNAATKIHRIKAILARRFQEGARTDEQ